MPHFKRSQFIPKPPEELWAFLIDGSTIQKLNPPIPGFKVLSNDIATIAVGVKVKYQIEILPGIKRRWVNKITECAEQNHIAEKQISGPFQYWHQRQEFENRDNGVWMTNHVHFRMKNGLVGKLAYKYCVRQRLESIFNFRASYLEKNFGGSPAIKSGAL